MNISTDLLDKAIFWTLNYFTDSDTQNVHIHLPSAIKLHFTAPYIDPALLIFENDADWGSGSFMGARFKSWTGRPTSNDDMLFPPPLMLERLRSRDLACILLRIDRTLYVTKTQAHLLLVEKRKGAIEVERVGKLTAVVGEDDGRFDLDVLEKHFTWSDIVLV